MSLIQFRWAKLKLECGNEKLDRQKTLNGWLLHLALGGLKIKTYFLWHALYTCIPVLTLNLPLKVNVLKWYFHPWPLNVESGNPSKLILNYLQKKKVIISIPFLFCFNHKEYDIIKSYFNKLWKLKLQKK